MSWIEEIDFEKADGMLKNIYDDAVGKRGKLSNILKVHSLNPKALKAHLELYLSIMFTDSSISREDCEMIATVVSIANKCEYCKNHHAAALLHYWNDRERLDRFTNDFNSVSLSENKRKMLDYSLKLTSDPSSVEEKDIEELRTHGFSDKDILNINLIVSYFNFVNRIAEGLGVEYDPDEVRGYNY
ncbi:MAG: peroxidase-related enzyme [candidate division Zixibacteria bacterium]|nr:peroxidase-related enzyme [candidate division Zixibacteria bacterium]